MIRTTKKNNFCCAINGIKRVSLTRNPFFQSITEDSLIYNKYQGQQFRPKNNNDRDLVNERIHFKEVLLIGPEGESFGVVPMKTALNKSYEYQMDLLCVSPQAHPPVCKIVDYGKYKFDKDKKAKEAKKNQKKTVVKEIRFTATTDKHDLETKAKAAIKFLEDGMKVKVAVYIKGRMMQRMDIVKETLSTFLSLVGDYASTDKEPELLGKDYYVMLNPKTSKKQEGQKNA